MYMAVSYKHAIVSVSYVFINVNRFYFALYLTVTTRVVVIRLIINECH